MKITLISQMVVGHDLLNGKYHPILWHAGTWTEIGREAGVVRFRHTLPYGVPGGYGQLTLAQVEALRGREYAKVTA